MRSSRNALPRLLISLFLGWAPTAFAQNLTLEGGYAQNRFDNGAGDNKGTLGLIFGFAIGGDATKDFAFQAPVYAEIRAGGMPPSYADILAGADVALRFKSLSFGPGMNFGYLFRGDVTDTTCLGQPVRLESSCNLSNDPGAGNDSSRGLGNLALVGVGGFGKYSFGPQGRAFIQARYMRYTVGHLTNINEPLLFSNVDLSGLPQLPNKDYPDFEGGRDIRLTAGYVLSSGVSGGKFLRVQYQDRRLNFTRDRDNATGVFDQHSRALSFGVGFLF